MPNLLDYIHETGDRSFRENPFSAPDSLALTQIVYMPMRRAHGKTVHLHQLAYGAQQGNRICPSAERYQQRRVGAQHLRALKRGFHGG